eukprot:CFRG5307T1
MDTVGVISLLAVAFIVLFLSGVTLRSIRRNASPMQPKRACVVVLGDFGRSPRMQFHCASLVRHDIDVDVISYVGSKPHEMITTNDRIKLHSLPTPSQLAPGLPRAAYLLAAVLKTLQLSITLTYRLLTIPRPQVILVQTPPAIPTLACVRVACSLRNCKMIVDWHNLGYSILALSRPEASLPVRVYKTYERILGPMADGNFCVTHAMKNWLKEQWHVEATTLYDRAPDIFRRLDITEQHELLLKLSVSHGGVLNGPTSHSTLFTQKDPTTGVVRLREERPILLVSSTSWTADEDFGVLLRAVEQYDSDVTRAGIGYYPGMVCIITGKGPLKGHYEKLIEEKKFSHVRVYTMWLEAEDYPRLLGSADVGVSLHYSSSGLDLPMKVVDMFGCGLPVCAIRFDCLDELVKDGVNGVVFESPEDLTSQFKNLFKGFPASTKQIENLRVGTSEFSSIRWNTSWDKTAWPIVQSVMTE